MGYKTCATDVPRSTYLQLAKLGTASTSQPVGLTDFVIFLYDGGEFTVDVGQVLLTLCI